MQVTAPQDPRLLHAATTSIALELEACRRERDDARSESLRSWFDGRAQGLERALELLDSVLDPRVARDGAPT